MLNFIRFNFKLIIAGFELLFLMMRMEHSNSVDSTTSSMHQRCAADSGIAEAPEVECEIPVVVRLHEEGWMKPDPVVRIVYNSKKATIRQHYYPEGGWGWVVVVSTAIAVAVAHGAQMVVAAALPWQMHLHPLHPHPHLQWITLPLAARGIITR